MIEFIIREFRGGDVRIITYEGKEGTYMHKCSKCFEECFADKRDFRCPYCNESEEEV